ncbi:MAG: hypothetical protein H7235_10960 [Bdellovibrionaceae bacterium]|nr:hypothetical protein [Pseudobdellovibrionaceae bacterium]
MFRLTSVVVSLLSLFSFQFAYSATLPDLNLTPGVLCSAADPDFKGYDYPSQVARCNRNIAVAEKLEVAKNYGNIAQSEWANYEFDHFLPLCAGGSNDIHNLWPQPIDEAREKDIIEVQVCTALKAGTMTQPQAIQKIHDWFQSMSAAGHSGKTNPSHQSPFLVEPNTALTLIQIPKNFICLENKSLTTSKLKINFTQSKNDEITNLKVQLLEKSGENELLNLDQKVIGGKITKAKSGPLENLLLFAVKYNQDRFNFYLPKNFAEAQNPFHAFFKISFEDSYPSLVQLQCSEI